jgi:hypothetical protein
MVRPQKRVQKASKASKAPGLAWFHGLNWPVEVAFLPQKYAN